MSGLNFYCHACHSRTRVSAEDFTCASCGSGFIEETTPGVGVGHMEDMDDGGGGGAAGFMMMPDDMFGGGGGNPFLEQIFGAMGGGGGGRGGGGGMPGGIVIHGSTRPRPQPNQDASGGEGGEAEEEGGGARGGGGGPHDFLGDQFLRSLISNLTGVPIGMAGGPGGGGGGIQFHIGGGGGGPGGNVMYGNPGDYVWGRGGFDAIVTQLLNQLEGSGAPPMPKANIDKEVQTIQITQKQVDDNLQCSVCWDDFTLGESVRQLRCEHIFHKDCIVPWLLEHATCPVCRQPLTEDAKAYTERVEQEEGGADSDIMASAAALAGGSSSGSSSGSSNGPSSSSDGGSTSSNERLPPLQDRLPHFRERNTHQQPQQLPSQRRRQMDVSDSLTDTISAVINSFMGVPQPSSSSNSGNSSNTGGGESSSSSQPRNNQRRPDFEDFDPE